MSRPTCWTIFLLAAICTVAFAPVRGDDGLLTQNSTEEALAADDLFSRVPIDSVFTPPARQSAVPGPGGQMPQPEVGKRVLNINQLVDLLRDSGLEPESDGEKTATVKLQHARWTFPVMLGLTEERDQLLFVLLLSGLESKTALSQEQLLALLAANVEHRPAVFSYSEKRKRLELLSSLPNEEITPRVIRDELRRLASAAESTAALWESSGGSATGSGPAPAVTAPAAPPQTAATPPAQATRPAAAAPAKAASVNLIGKWSAARSNKEAFALQLNSDGTFVLVYVKDGKQSRSTGKFALADGQLTLTTSDGSKFSGSLSNASARSFEFIPQSSAASKLTFQRAS